MQFTKKYSAKNIKVGKHLKVEGDKHNIVKIIPNKPFSVLFLGNANNWETGDPVSVQFTLNEVYRITSITKTETGACILGMFIDNVEHFMYLSRVKGLFSLEV